MNLSAQSHGLKCVELPAWRKTHLHFLVVLHSLWTGGDEAQNTAAQHMTLWSVGYFEL